MKVTVTSRVDGDLDRWLREYAAARKWSMSQTIYELLSEQRKDIQCREMIRKADGRETAQEFMARLDRIVEKKRVSDDEVMRISGESVE